MVLTVYALYMGKGRQLERMTAVSWLSSDGAAIFLCMASHGLTNCVFSLLPYEHSSSIIISVMLDYIGKVYCFCNDFAQLFE